MSFPTPIATDFVVANRAQVDCAKQCSLGADRWSNRVLTIDCESGTLTISRHHHPRNLYYHALAPAMVQMWPHFSRETVADDWHSAEAKLTLCLLGRVAAVPDFSAQEVALVGIPLPLSSAAQSSDAAVSAQMAYPPSEYTPLPRAAGEAERQRKNTPGTFDAWVLRFSTKASYAAAVQMLGRMPGVRFSKTETTTNAEADMTPLPFSAIPVAMMSKSKRATHKRTAAHSRVAPS